MDKSPLTEAFDELVYQVINQHMLEVESKQEWKAKDKVAHVYASRLKDKLPREETVALIKLQDAMAERSNVEVEYAYRSGMADGLRLLLRMLVG